MIGDGELVRVVRERLVGVERVPQPSPGINPGGDCFACATAAIFKHLWPGEAATLDVASCIRDAWTRENSSGDPTTVNIWSETGPAWRRLARSIGVEAEIRCEKPQWHPARGPEDWEDAYYIHQPDWAFWTDAVLAAGWIPYVAAKADPSPPVTPDGMDNRGAAHVLVVDGVRQVRRREGEYEFDRDEVHVVCSKNGSYWVDEGRFVRLHGAAAWWLIRPR